MLGVTSTIGRVAVIAGVYVGGTLENPSQVESDELFELIRVYILASLQKYHPPWVLWGRRIQDIEGSSRIEDNSGCSAVS